MTGGGTGGRARPSARHDPPAAKPPGGVGYSGTPLLRKLGYRPGLRVALIDAPANYRALLGELPPDVTFCGLADGELELVHVFATRTADLERWVPRLRGTIVPTGTIWASWPKKASRVATDLTGDVVRRIALSNGLVDVKVCAVDATWSALKLVIPRALR